MNAVLENVLLSTKKIINEKLGWNLLFHSIPQWAVLDQMQFFNQSGYFLQI